MPRPKKTTPTVATTEPDTNLNPDRAQVAAVADLPHAPRIVVDSIPEGTPATVARVEQVPDDGEDGEPLDAYAARLQAERNALVDGLRATIAEQSARIAELTAERDAIQHHHDEWMKFRGDADWELANLRRDGREEDRKRIAELEAEFAATRTAPEPTPARPVATWTGDVLLTPGGKVLGRVNVSRGTFGHLQAAPIYYPADDQERLGPIGTIETAREWVSDYARKIGWVVA